MSGCARAGQAQGRREVRHPSRGSSQSGLVREAVKRGLLEEAYLVLGRKLIVFVDEVPVNVVRVDAVAAELVGDGDALFDKVSPGLVLDVNPAFVGELAQWIPQQTAVFGLLPDRVPITVGLLNGAGIEIANDEDIGVLCLGACQMTLKVLPSR